MTVNHKDVRALNIQSPTVVVGGHRKAESKYLVMLAKVIAKLALCNEAKFRHGAAIGTDWVTHEVCHQLNYLDVRAFLPWDGYDNQSVTDRVFDCSEVSDSMTDYYVQEYYNKFRKDEPTRGIKSLMKRNAVTLLGLQMIDRPDLVLTVSKPLLVSKNSEGELDVIIDSLGGTGMLTRMCYGMSIPNLNLMYPPHYQLLESWISE